MATSAPSAQQLPRTTQSMGRLRALLAMTRPTHIALIVVILVNGALLGLWRSGTAGLEPVAVAVALGLVVAVAASVHLANEAADHETDRLAERTPFSGGSGALAASAMRPEVPLALALLLAGIVVATTVAALALGAMAPVAAVLLLAGLAGGLAYSLPPVAAMRHGWGEPLNALLGGLLLPLFGVAVVAQSIDVPQVVAFLPFAFVAFASVLATAWPDRVADAATAKDTMSVRLPPASLRRIHLAASVAFVAATLLSVALGAMPQALTGLLVVPALATGLYTYTRRRSPLPNVAAMVGLALLTAIMLTLEMAALR